MRLRRFVLVGAIAAAAMLAIAVRGFVRARGYLHMRRTVVSADAEATARGRLPGMTRVTLRTSDGLRLLGWFAPGAQRAAVILVHGGGANRLQLLDEACLFSRHGYGVLVYDSRANGESDGATDTWGDGEQRDVSAALDYVSARPDVDPGRIAVLGFSIGGSSVAMETSGDTRARAVILYATWSSFEAEMKEKFHRYGPLSWWPALYAMRAAGIDPENIRPIEALRRISPRPLLMIAGTRDDDTPVAIMQTLFAAAGEPKELWVVPGAGHGGVFATAPVEYETRVTRFLDHALLDVGCG